MDVLLFMSASKVAVGSLMKTVYWFQLTCTIVMKQIFQCIGCLFHQLEKVDGLPWEVRQCAIVVPHAYATG